MDPQWQQREQIRNDEMAAVLSTLNGITRGGSSPATESLVVSLARRLIHNLNGEELTMLASGVVPESIQDETITAELYRPTAPATSRALEIRPDRNYRWSARGGDLWMRENKAEINATIVDCQVAQHVHRQLPGAPKGELAGIL